MKAKEIAEQIYWHAEHGEAKKAELLLWSVFQEGFNRGADHGLQMAQRANAGEVSETNLEASSDWWHTLYV